LIRFVCFFALVSTQFIAASDSSLAAVRSNSTSVAPSNQGERYWTVSPVGQTAELLTLFSRSEPAGSPGPSDDIPVVSLLRDTLGDTARENDRILYVWLLPSAARSLPQRMLAGVPFFYWRLGKGPDKVTSRDLRPLLDLNTPQHPVMSEVRRSLLQWTAFDPLMMPVRASSRMYRSNESDAERIKLEETITYLRGAPSAESEPSMPSSEQLNTVIARLELRKQLLGGLFGDKAASRYGMESEFESERVRSRNWELLRQCAEKTGLYFESISLGVQKDQYGLLWFPQGETHKPTGTSLKPIWKLLNIKDPWADERLNRTDALYRRPGSNPTFSQRDGAQSESAANYVPLALYSLDYPKFPLLLVNFRDELQVRRREVAQRAVNEVTAGVIGISHITNWYYYAGSMLYNLVWSRRGIAVDQAARLDCYSQFRAQLASDGSLDPQLRDALMKQVDRLLVNPLPVPVERKAELAAAHFTEIQKGLADDGPLTKRLNDERRAELAAFGQGRGARLLQSALHMATFGRYTQRVSPDKLSLSTLDRERRVLYRLEFLQGLVKQGTQPEVAFKTAQIEESVADLNTLMSQVSSRRIRERAVATLDRLKSLSRDAGVQTQCAVALITLRQTPEAVRAESIPAIATSPRVTRLPAGRMDSFK
jgi:bacterioferritin-associated ferredoxin